MDRAKFKYLSQLFPSNFLDFKNWANWLWQMQNRITKIEKLKALLNLDSTQLKKLSSVEEKFRAAITPYYLSLADFSNPDDPILLQSIPSMKEIDFYHIGKNDPLSEEQDMPVDGLTHRYEDRALIVVTNACAMFCRHCTRKRIWNSTDKAISKAQINKMIDYIKQNTQIRDVIVSGGDPLTLPNSFIEEIIRKIREIRHVEIIRIGTRIPVTLPMRIDKELCEILDKYAPIWINTQFNHPAEITEESANAIDMLIRHGICVNNQSVLLKGINDNPETILKLCRELVKIKVRPYYLFQCDQVAGVEHFRTRISKGIEIMEYLRGRTTGFSIPLFVVDGPDGTGKIPILPNYLISQSENMSILRNYEGVIIGYREPELYTTYYNSISTKNQYSNETRSLKSTYSISSKNNFEKSKTTEIQGISSLFSGQISSIVPRNIIRFDRRKVFETIKDSPNSK